MKSSVDVCEGVTVVTVSGDLDVSDALSLRETLGQAQGDSARPVLLDLAEVGFIDSAGIGLLVSAHRRAAGGGGQFALAALTPTVARVLELTRTDRMLTVLPTVEAGVRALRPAGVAE
ncbi:MAG: STAS domain-containing protein [Propionibacteriales bacterium]|nr:STAS domain-containing protein [Propionibacteriales bacterium]